MKNHSGWKFSKFNIRKIQSRCCMVPTSERIPGPPIRCAVAAMVYPVSVLYL
jgi:hypothetical protein